MSIIKHVTLQKIVTHDFRYDPRIIYIFVVGIIIIPGTEILKNITVCKFHIPGCSSCELLRCTLK